MHPAGDTGLPLQTYRRGIYVFAHPDARFRGQDRLQNDRSISHRPPQTAVRGPHTTTAKTYPQVGQVTPSGIRLRIWYPRRWMQI